MSLFNYFSYVDKCKFYKLIYYETSVQEKYIFNQIVINVHFV